MDILKIKEWVKLNRNKIIGALFIILVLIVAFFSDGNLKKSDKTKNDALPENELYSDVIEKDSIENTKETETDKYYDKSDSISDSDKNKVVENNSDDIALKENNTNPADNLENKDNQENKQDSIYETTTKKTEEDITDNNKPSENISETTTATNSTTVKTSTDKNETTTAKKDKNECKISISCVNILNNMDKLDKDKKDIVPKDGVILKEKTVTFKEGESVFDVLQRVCKENKIHMEASFTPLYNSSYVEGIYNLYEFDCGSLSGWMYSVNGEFLNYGSSQVKVRNGDVIKWVYTCDLGKDVK